MREIEIDREEAEKHWKFLEKYFHMIFVDGYIHGAKHERERKKE